ncbi:MAG: hypothetical protein WD988_03740 [Candidatus Curtissbacteria bacterium]
MADIDKKPITEETAKRLTDMLSKHPVGAQSINLAKKPVYHIRNSQVLVATVGFAGITLVAFGLENLINTIPILSSPIAEILIGLILIIVSGVSLSKIIK